MTIAKMPKLPLSPTKKEVQKSLEKRVFDFDSKDVSELIESAPDGKKSTSKWKLKGKKVIITHSIYPEDLEKLDAMAESMGIKRAQLINMLIQKELFKFNSNASDIY